MKGTQAFCANAHMESAHCDEPDVASRRNVVAGSESVGKVVATFATSEERAACGASGEQGCGDRIHSAAEFLGWGWQTASRREEKWSRSRVCHSRVAPVCEEHPHQKPTRSWRKTVQDHSVLHRGLLPVILAVQLGLVVCESRTSTYVRGPTSVYCGSGSSPPTLFESATICQSYKDLSPPLHRRSMSLGSEGLRLRAQADGLRLRHSPRPVCNEAVLILDLDKTSIFGNDGNDLGISLQWMEKPDEAVQGLYKLLVSPCVRPAFEEFRSKARKVHVVIYTRRPQVLKYQSCFRDCVVPIKYKPEWHHDGQLYLPPSIRRSEDVLRFYCGPQLLEDEVNDVKKSMERLIAARDALTEALGLDASPTVVVTATDKSVEDTVRHLKLPETNALLIDDNTALQYDPKTVVVDTFEALPELQRREVLSYMQEQLPTGELDEELVEYLEGARDSEKALEWDAAEEAWRWRIPVATAPVQLWKLPPLKSDGTPWERASDSGFGMPPWAEASPSPHPRTSKSNALLSPVTPELADGTSSARVDLKAVAERAAKLREEQGLGVLKPPRARSGALELYSGE